MRFRLFDARGEPQRNSIPLVERSRSGLFTWSGGGAINRRAIAISPGRRARLEFHANRAASRLLVIEILEILAERVCVRVRMCERARERERERRGGGGSSPPSCCTSLLFRPSRAFHDVIATCFLLPLRERNPWNRPWMKSFRRKRNDRAHRGSLAHSRIHFRQLFLDNLVSFFLFLSFRGIAISDENFEGNYIRSEVGRGGRWDLGPIMTFLFFSFFEVNVL